MTSTALSELHVNRGALLYLWLGRWNAEMPLICMAGRIAKERSPASSS